VIGPILARKLVATLPRNAASLFNPWAEVCPDDLESNGPEAKLERLGAHLDCEPRFILCGEAVGYQGCRHSGIAFTSERLLGEGVIPRVAQTGRLTSRRLPYSEPSATIVWKALYQHGIETQTILWNALQVHPFKGSERNSNRTPTMAEVALGAPAVRLLVDNFPGAIIVAVGGTARRLLKGMGVSATAEVRHPAYGGALEFSAGIAKLVELSGQGAFARN